MEAQAIDRVHRLGQLDDVSTGTSLTNVYLQRCLTGYSNTIHHQRDSGRTDP